ncbi:MAG TPA: glycerol-3-phosphate dehydrogenase, partial [Dongiaceae bacterium]|nr:glycerol-3-phosphate dehydrogenase [Dongiaceae bacterium]
IKGSHIVVPRLYDGEHAYILQNVDRRIVFAIPYETDFTLIGTTDVPFDGDLGAVGISPAETDYLCEVVNRHFLRTVAPADVVWSYAGVRPLYDDEAVDAAAVTRDYALELDAAGAAAPLLSVLGGKITTYRRLAGQVLDKLRPHFPRAGPAWTHAAPLPGGDMPDADFDRFLLDLRARKPWLPVALARRYARAYGTRVERLLGAAAALRDLGAEIGPGLYEAELDYLRRNEWAVDAEDVLWRRSKLGLHMPEAARRRVADWFRAAAPRSREAAVP